MSGQPRSIRSSPPLLIGIGIIAVGFFVLPLVGLLWRVPWADLPELLGRPVVREALGLSLLSSLAAAALSAIFGIPLAWMLARVDLPGRSVLRAIVTLPMVLPPVVGGAALLFAFGRRGIVGGGLEEVTGLLLPFSTTGVIIANTFVALPFLVVTVEGGFRNLDPRYEAAASSLGASPLEVFRRVTLPMARPSIVAGIVLAWARALGEFGATITFAGNLQGRTQTLPLAVFVALESDRDEAVAMSLVLVVISVAVLIGLRDRWWRT